METLSVRSASVKAAPVGPAAFFDDDHGPHDFLVDDLDTVNEWNALDADPPSEADRRWWSAHAADAGPGLLDPTGEILEALLDVAERAGWQGDGLPEFGPLCGEQLLAVLDAWMAGRRQRIDDEAELTAERGGAAW